jgi:cytochrome c-type protein NapB
MRGSAKSALWILILLVTVFPLTAGAGDKEVDDGIDLYFRDVDLSALSSQDLEIYIGTDPGESTRLDRAFPDAPPQISHNVVDMLPISRGSNDCMDCHHPDNATEKDDMPLPESHFQSPVMASGEKGEAMVWKVKGYRKGTSVAGSRFNCTMCHAPQASNVKTPKNDFVRTEAKAPK